MRSKKRGVSDNRFASQGEHRLLHCFHFPPHQQCTGTEQLHCFHFHSNLACKPCSINCVKALHHQCTAAAFTTDLIPALHCWLPLVSAMLVAFHVFLTQCNRSRCVKAGLNVDEFLRLKGLFGGSLVKEVAAGGEWWGGKKLSSPSRSPPLCLLQHSQPFFLHVGFKNIQSSSAVSDFPITAFRDFQIF